MCGVVKKFAIINGVSKKFAIVNEVAKDKSLRSSGYGDFL